MMSEDHNRSCMCSSCFYRRVTEKPLLRRITAKGSRIDKIFLGKFIPLREKKNVTVRAQYNHLRNEELQRETSLTRFSEKVLDTSKRDHIPHTQERKETDSNSIVLGLVTLKNKDETLQSYKSINICTCCSCNSSVLAREAGTKYIRDNTSGKKMYKISRSRKKNEHQTIRSPKAKLIRSEPTTKSTLSSSVDRAAKVKSSICPLYNRQYHSEKECLDYSYCTMGEGNLQNVGVENTTKPSLITKNLITSGGDKLHKKKTEVEADETKSLLNENKYSSIRSLKTCFCTLKLLKKVNAKPKIFKSALKELPEIERDFPKSTNSKKAIQKQKINEQTIQIKTKVQHKPRTLTTKSKFQIKNKKTISTELITCPCSVKHNVYPNRLNNKLAKNILPKKDNSKSHKHPKRETFYSNTDYGNTISNKSSQTSTCLRSLVQIPHVSRNYTLKNKHTPEPHSRIPNVTRPKEHCYSSLGRLKSNPHATNFLLEQKTNANNTFMDRQKNASNLALHNFYGNNCLGKKRGTFFKSTINRCFCKLVQYGKDKNNGNLAKDSRAHAFSEITSLAKNNNQPIPVSISRMSCDSSINSRIETKMHRIKLRPIQHEKCPKHTTTPHHNHILKEEGKAPCWESTTDVCVTCSRRKAKNNKYYIMSKEGHSSIVQYEWIPTRSVNRFQTNVIRKSKKGEAVDLKQHSCRLFTNKDRNPPPLYFVNAAETGNVKNPTVSPATPYLSHSQSMKDMQHYEQFSPNSQSLGLFSHREDGIWHQSKSLRDPLKKYASVKKEHFSNSYTDTVSYCACLGQQTPRRQLTKSEMNNFTNSKESGIEMDLRSTMRSYQHLQRFCVMNLNIVNPKIKQQKIKPFDNEQGFCVENECDQFKCLNVMRNRFNSQTSTMTPVPQIKQKFVQHFRPQMNTRTLSPCIHCEQDHIHTCAQWSCPSEPKQGKQKNSKAINQKKDLIIITNLSGMSMPGCLLTCVKKGSANPKGPKEKCSVACNQKRDPCKGTRVINPNKTTMKGTVTVSKNGLTLVQNTTNQALLWHDSEHVYPNSSLKRRRKKRKCFKKKNKHADSASTINYNYPPSVTESVQSKAISTTTTLRPRKNRKSITTVTVSGLITVCKKQRELVVTQNSTCSFQTQSSRKPMKKIAAATGTRRKKYMQKGTDPLDENPDLQCICKCIRKQKLFTPKPYPRNVKLVDYAPADGRNATVTGVVHGGTKLRRPEKMKRSSFERGAVTRKLKPYEYKGVSTKRERGVGTIRSQTKSVSSATEPYRARNVRFAGKLPKNSKPTKKQTERGESSYCFRVVLSTDKVAKQKSFKKRAARFDNQVVPCPNSATSLKRCFCTTSLKNSENQAVYYRPVVKETNNSTNYQKEYPGISSLHKSELNVIQTSHKLFYAPYEFLPIECDPSERTERVIKRKQYKKNNLSIDKTDITTNSTQFKIGTCAQLLPSNIDILSSDKNNKELLYKKSYIRSTECTQDNRLIEENIGIAKNNTDLQSDTASYTTQEYVTDSMGVMWNTGNLTGMTQHLNKHLYALRLETSPKSAGVGADNKKGETKGVMGAKGTKNYRSQARLGAYECKASDCALGNYNPKMCEKRFKSKRLSPGECLIEDCALGNYNPKKCEKRILARTISPTQCNPIDCAINNFNAKKGDKRIKRKAVGPGECNSGECLFGNNNLKKIETKVQTKNNRRQATVSQRQKTEKTVATPEKVERKTRQLSHVVEERRFKSLKYPFDAGVAITSSISLDIEFYKQERLPKLPPRPVPPKPVRKIDQKVAVQTKIKPYQVSSTSSQSISIQVKPQKKNVIRKCFCTLMRMTSTKDKKIGAKQMDATVANVGVITKDKYLEPELFYTYEKKPKRGMRTFCGGTAISKRSLSTMTEKRTYKSEKSEFKGAPKQAYIIEKTSGTMTQKVKPRKYEQQEVREKPPCAPCPPCKTQGICFSDYRITSRLSFDIEVSKYETGDRSGSSSKSVPLSSIQGAVSATPKEKMPSRKTATTKLPSKSSSEHAVKYKNESQNYVHPSLKRCFCTMKLQKPYTHQQVVNYMTTTITPLNSFKCNLRAQEKPSNLHSTNTYLIHDSKDQSSNNSSRRSSKSKIFNEFLNKFEKAVLTKLFHKSPDVKHTLTKEKLMQAADPLQCSPCLCDSNQMSFSTEMKTIYPYNSSKFHNYTSCTMLCKRNRSRFHHHSRSHYLHYDFITKKRRHKRQYITEKVHKDFNKRANFLNKLKNTFHSIFTLFRRKKYRYVICSTENNKPNNHSERIKKNKALPTTKVDILKASKSDRQKCHVVNNIDPLKTCKSDRQPVNPKVIINKQKKVGGPKVFINVKSNTRQSKCTEQGIKLYSRFQSGDIEIRQSRRKDCLPKYYKPYFNQGLKCTQYNPKVHKQKTDLARKHGRKKKRKGKFESACCNDPRERMEDKQHKDIRKIKIEKGKHNKGKFAKERRKSKSGEEDRNEVHERLLHKSIHDPMYSLNIDSVTRLY